MNSPISIFNMCISDINNMRAIYMYLKDHSKVPEDDLTDLLRSELVNLVSAMDHFFHEIVRDGIIRSYMGKLPLTTKCQAIPLKLSTLIKAVECSQIKNPTCNEETAVHWINKEVKEILKSMSFQKIEKIKDALSYVWSEKHKMHLIIKKMNYLFTQSTDNEKQKFLEGRIDLIVSRRNQIVHEADFNISINAKNAIDTIELDDMILIVKEFVYSIYENITGDSSFSRL